MFEEGKATLSIKNTSAGKSIAYKIQTTDPTAFIVKGMQGILNAQSVEEIKDAGENSILIEIMLQRNDDGVKRQKFLVKALPCNLQSSEHFQLAEFWANHNQ